MKLIIDSNQLGYMAAYVFGGLSYQNKSTGVIYGFLSQLLKIVDKFETNQLIFCWDSKKSYRKLFYSGYKENRRKDLSKREAENIQLAFHQFVQLRQDILPRMGFKNVFHQTGYEADDLVAWITARFPNQYIVVSSDMDFWQLLSEGRKHFVRCYDLRKHRVFTKYEFEKGWGIPPSQWTEVKAIAGDPSDNIPGVQGVGLLTAIKYVQGVLDGVKKERIENDYDLRRRNFHLIALPYRGTRDIEIDRIEGEEKFYSMDFMDVFNERGFSSFLGDGFEKWRKGFRLKSGRGESES